MYEICCLWCLSSLDVSFSLRPSRSLRLFLHHSLLSLLFNWFFVLVTPPVLSHALCSWRLLISVVSVVKALYFHNSRSLSLARPDLSIYYRCLDRPAGDATTLLQVFLSCFVRGAYKKIWKANAFVDALVDAQMKGKRMTHETARDDLMNHPPHAKKCCPALPFHCHSFLSLILPLFCPLSTSSSSPPLSLSLDCSLLAPLTNLSSPLSSLLSPSRPLIACRALSDLWNTFGIETVLLYVAVLLKRRVVMIGGDAEHAVVLARTVAQLTPHRNDTTQLYPNYDIVRRGRSRDCTVCLYG